MIRTYLDAGVLIASVRGNPDPAQAARGLIADPEREFVASVFLRLEVLPKALYHRRTAEANFYHQFSARVVAWAEPSETAADLAEHEAVPSGLSAPDALHVAAAMMLGADELVTTEGLRKPIHRVTGVRVIAS